MRGIYFIKSNVSSAAISLKTSMQIHEINLGIMFNNLLQDGYGIKNYFAKIYVWIKDYK